MKKLTILLVATIFSFSLSGQVDSGATKINVSIQARDAEYIGSFIAHQEQYEDLWDNLKVRFRTATPPSGTTIVVVNGIEISTWLGIVTRLRNNVAARVVNSFGRVDGALRATGNTYLINQLNKGNVADTATFRTMQEFGKNKLKKN